MDDNIFVKWNDKWPEPSESVANIIFDTDIGPDYDDTGVAVMLHNYANKGKVNILAMLCSTSAPYGAAYLNLLNIYFGRRDIPVGTLKSKLDILPTCRGYNFTINEYAKYETDILDGFHARDAVEVYREVLAAQPDNSVTILATGMLSNLCDLLKSKPDRCSPLSGVELVAKKVKLVSSMAGKFPEGKEFNVEKDAPAAQYVVDNWPTPIMFSGFEIGEKIRTGNRLSQTEADSPLRGGYHPQMCSWDLTSALYAVEGLGDYWTAKRGDVKIIDGYNYFTENEKDGARAYLVEEMSPEQLADLLEGYLLEPKKNNPSKTKTYGIDSSDAVKTGTWNIYKPHSYFHNGSALESREEQSSLSVTFDGTGISIHGGISPVNGKFAVYIDGMLEKVIDTYSENTFDSLCLYSNFGLDKKEHSLEITVLGEKNDKSSGIGGVIDFFKVVTENENI